ncbi:MAG TPA: dTDP-glucose 4,6-dehydratase [Eudoraea sp.]|nr:dTDP-glucose 4,6-dehydratase [Eudoraea sp.]
MNGPDARKNILITGGAGFIGSNFIPFFLEANPALGVVNLDKLTYAGSLDNLKDVKGNKRYIFVKGDICDKDLTRSLFEEYHISGVIHFAAESHVDNSIERPAHFIKTNIEGTFVLLETARICWSSSKDQWGENRFHHISTDEVYGSLGEGGFFTEQTPYAPNSPYSASKAAADFLVRSYHHTYGLNTVTSNCSNNYGPKQHDEKLIPTIIRKALKGEPIPIYGDGSNIRDWLYVQDHCEALQLVFQKGRAGETYAIGGDNEHNNLYIARIVCTVLDHHQPRAKGSYTEQITLVEDRPGHDYRYAIDCSKIRDELGWEAGEDFNSGLQKTVQWYLKKYRTV